MLRPGEVLIHPEGMEKDFLITDDCGGAGLLDDLTTIERKVWAARFRAIADLIENPSPKRHQAWTELHKGTTL